MLKFIASVKKSETQSSNLKYVNKVFESFTVIIKLEFALLFY
jgi:hypothetical protein